MTEKRFKITIGEFEEENVTDILNNIEITEISDMCAKLNELHEENIMLKERRHEDINDLSVIAMRFKALEKENEQLKIRFNKEKNTAMSLGSKCDWLMCENRELKKENEQLKQELVDADKLNDKQCWDCKYNESVHDGVALDGMCAKDCMNIDGYFDWKYHKFKEECVCPFWELEE